MQKTYLFYDLETTGLNKAFDQVLQFAAIRTDMNLKELERSEINFSLRPDVCPAPEAYLTHQIPVADALDAVCEYEGIKCIHAMVNTPGTISVGYNSLGFDDEFLRFSFYRNLLAPYTHQYANFCGRMDIYPITQFYWLYQQDALQWPEIKGKVSLKLESVARENNLMEGAAHDAMVDVEATVNLARRLKQSTKMWAYVTGYFDKNTDKERLQKLPQVMPELQTNLREAILISGRFGVGRFCQVPAVCLGEHRHYKNQTVWLALDNEKLSKATLTNFAETIWSMSKKYSEPAFLVPMAKRFERHLTPERIALCESNKEFLTKHSTLFHAMREHYLSYTHPDIPMLDLDASLYQRGFQSRDEQAWCATFHQAAWPEKFVLAQTCPYRHLKEQCERLLGRNAPSALPESVQAAFADHLRSVWEGDARADFRGEQAGDPALQIAHIESLLVDANPKQQALLLQLKGHYQRFCRN